jgi:hypothetical protein
MFSNFGAIRTGSTVKVFMGAGWDKGTVHMVSGSSCCVQLAKRMVTVYDLRNIKSA